MQVDFQRFRIEEVTDKRESRFALAEPWLVGDRLQATDGYALASVKVELDKGDTDGPVTAEAIKTARKLKVDKIVANKDLDIRGVHLERAADGATPKSADTLAENEEPAVTVRLDGALLFKLLKAIGVHKSYQGGPAVIHLKVYDGKMKPIRLENLADGDAEEPEAVGLLMPLKSK